MVAPFEQSKEVAPDAPLAVPELGAMVLPQSEEVILAVVERQAVSPCCPQELSDFPLRMPPPAAKPAAAWTWLKRQSKNW